MGAGNTALCLFPSIYFNFFSLLFPPLCAFELFKYLIKYRPNKNQFLSGVMGLQLVCDCEAKEFCHAELLADLAFNSWNNASDKGSVA